MRIALWIFVTCAAIAAVSAFLPALELRVHGFAPRRTSLSLYTAARDRELARALYGRYARSAGRVWGEAATGALVPHLGRHKVHLDDAQDAMQTLDELDDADVRHAGMAIAGAVWTLLAACVVMAALGFGELMGGELRPRRLYAAAALAVLAAALGVGALLGCREAAWQANDELGANALAAGGGIYLLPLAACVALGAISCAIVLARRARRASAAPPPRPAGSSA